MLTLSRTSRTERGSMVLVVLLRAQATGIWTLDVGIVGFVVAIP